MLEELKVKLSREEIFALKFKGLALNETKIFKSLRGFTPTGKPKSISITPLNLIKFEKFLVSAKEYLEASQAFGDEFDYANITNMEHFAPSEYKI